MGTWGVGVLEDDFACDVRDDYLRLLDAGQSPSQIRAALERQYAGSLEPDEAEDEGPVFWLALARTQWECGVLQDDALAHVEKIVQSGSGLIRWEAAFDRDDYGRRRTALDRLLKTIRKPRAAAQIRRPRTRRSRYARAMYPPGTCLAVPLSDGDWGAALVLAEKEDAKGEGGGANLVGVLRYKSPHKPELAAFQRREWLMLTHHQWKNAREISWCATRNYRTSAPALEVAGSIPITDADPKDSNAYGGWNLGLQVEKQFAWEDGVRD